MLAGRRHREDVFRHLNSWLEQLDEVLQKRLALDELSDTNFQRLLSGSELKSEANAKELESSEGSQEAVQRAASSPGKLAVSPGKSVSARNLHQNSQYELAKAEETRILFSFGNLLSDLDNGVAKRLGAVLEDVRVVSRTRSVLRQRMQQLGRCAARIVNTTCFNGFFAVIIITNSLRLGRL